MGKHSYQQQLRRQIQQWQARIDGLRAQAGENRTGCPGRIEEQIEDLRAKQDAANRKLEQLDREPRGLRRAYRATAAVRDSVNRIVRRFVPGAR
ncbi:MAG: hypothetical protein U5R46_12170 [Gammaproteobacteria bacterium]|nr:hypothetical protein [Gammaproteobacteria bacterium]